MLLVLPLILIEIYLFTTLLFLEFGPVNWILENDNKFWILMLMYHISFISGYLLYLKKQNIKKVEVIKTFDYETFILKYFWLYLFIALLGSLIVYKNTVHSGSYIPYNFFSDFFMGLNHPDFVRDRFYTNMSTYKSEKIFTIFYTFIVIFKFSLIVVLTVLWERLSIFQKTSALFISLIPIFATISVGTNKLVLDTLLVFSFALLIHALSRKKGYKIQSLFKRKILIVFIISLSLFFPFYFNKSMSERSSTFSYMENQTKPGNITILPNVNIDSPTNDFYKNINPKLTNFLVKVDFYLVQGYYGMSLAIDEEFETTYGIGHSIFLLDQFKYFFNIDLISRTFQYKINDEWHRLVQWHSFYSQIANDVGFYGVSIVMFILGYLLSAIFRSAIIDNNLVAKSMIPLFVIMFIYMPANNQVFNFMETLFSFIFLFIIWKFFSYKTDRVIN